MKNTLRAVSNIDFALLKQQKQLLIETIGSIEEEAENFGDNAQDKLDALNSILNMIDEIQDAVVKDGFKKEKEVVEWKENQLGRCKAEIERIQKIMEEVQAVDVTKTVNVINNVYTPHAKKYYGTGEWVADADGKKYEEE